MRSLVLFAPLGFGLVLGLAGCSQPSSNSEPGLQDYNAVIHGAAPLNATGTGASTAADPGQPGFSTDAAAAAIDQAANPALGSQPATALPGSDAALFDPNRPRGDAPTNIATDSGEMTGYATQGLSDENSFKAVTERTSIEGDKERIAANRAQYVVIQPTDIPQRSDNSGPDIVKYALATTNPVGASLYNRPSFYLVNVGTACQKYTSPDFAQQAFLSKGGPTHDPKGLDPDGDGFACDWDPTPFRNALKQ